MVLAAPCWDESAVPHEGLRERPLRMQFFVPGNEENGRCQGYPIGGDHGMALVSGISSEFHLWDHPWGGRIIEDDKAACKSWVLDFSKHVDPIAQTKFIRSTDAFKDYCLLTIIF